MSRPGVFLTFEGGEGTGKSTQARLLVERLESAGVPTLPVREPGGTPLGDTLRDLLLSPEGPDPSPRAELMMYEASRAHLVDGVLLPALDRGDVVVCDRFTDSTLAYQGYGRGLGPDWVRRLNDWSAGGLRPDMTILLDVPLETALARATAQGADRLESELAEFHARVLGGFAEIARSEPERVRVVNADRTPDEVGEDVWTLVSGLLDERGVIA